MAVINSKNSYTYFLSELTRLGDYLTIAEVRHKCPDLSLSEKMFLTIDNRVVNNKHCGLDVIDLKNFDRIPKDGNILVRMLTKFSIWFTLVVILLSQFS